MLESEHSNDKDHQLKHILSENMRMLPDKSNESDKFGLHLDVEADDDDELHITEHKSFRESNKLRPQFEAKLKEHEKKHQIQYNEKERMGLLPKKKEEATDTKETVKDDNTTRNFKKKKRVFGDRQTIDTGEYSNY